MYFFDLEDYYSSRIIGQYNSRFQTDWEDVFTSGRATKDAYIATFGNWYSASTICASGPCRARIDELYKLITDYSVPEYDNKGSVNLAFTYNSAKFGTMMTGMHYPPTYVDSNVLSGGWTGKCFDEQVYYDYVNSFKDLKCVVNELIYLIDGDDVGRCEKYSLVSDSGNTVTNCGDCSAVNLDTFLTTDLPNINNVDEFRKAINAELIDTKNRQTLSSYPTLRLLYERYLGNCTDCDKTLNRFTYDTMNTFIDLIGKHWVDLAEQFVPATTIWGATDVYRNTVFHQQKHKYRRSNLEFNVQNLVDNPFITCVSYSGVSQIDYGKIRTIDYSTQSTIYDVTLQSMPEILAASATTINFQATAQSDETPRSNPDTPIKLNFQVGTTTQTFGNLTTSQVNAIQTQSNTIAQQSISSNVFLIKKTVKYGLSSGPSHCSPTFYGNVTIPKGYVKADMLN